MLFEEFILRFVRLEAAFVSVLAKTDNCISFRINDEAMIVLRHLEDLLNTLLEEEDGAFVVSLNLVNKCLDFKFIEGGS